MTGSAGKKVRFRVEDPALGCGFSWTVETRRAGDVYLFCREASRWMHTSLHHTGRWHHAVTADGQQVEPDTEGYLDVGRSRRPFAPGLWLASRVWVPVSELRQQPSSGQSDGKVVSQIPPVQGFDAVFLEVVLEDPGADAVRVDNVFPIAQFALPEGRRVHVIGRAANTGVDVHAEFVDVIGQAEDDLRSRFAWDGSPTRIAVLLQEDEDLGFKHQVEIALG